MKLLISVLANAAILFGVAYFLPYDASTGTGVLASGGWRLWIAGGIILGILNTLVRPVLKILGFPFILITFGLFILVINGIILKLLEKAVQALGSNFWEMQYEIHGVAIFAIAVAIFTVFNIVANTLVKR